MGNRRFLRTQRGTEDTEGHRDGRRASARRTLNWRFGSLEAWRLGLFAAYAALYSASSVAPQGRSCIS